MQTFALFGAENPDFSKFMVCPHGQGEEEGSNFRDFMRASFMDDP